MKSVCVYCGASTGNQPDHARLAARVGRALARRGLELVYGGGKVGLMGIVADAALAAGGRVVGVIPAVLMNKELAHDGATELRQVGSMHERKALMERSADGFIALPGGLGTLDELFEIFTWSQLGLHRKPIGLLNCRGYYDPLLAFLDGAVAAGFVGAAQRDALLIATDVDDLLDRFAGYRPPATRRWLNRDDV